MGATVEFDHVAKRYGNGPLILDNLQLRANSRDFISLIGPSGCGKSTILKLIAGLGEPTAGRLLIGGKPPAGVSGELSYVFQEATLLPWLSAHANVEVPLRLLNKPAAERRKVALEALRLVRLSDHADYFPRQLSGGQKMRVSIARALAQSPELLLLDEPFGALDEMTRDHLNEELLEIREKAAWTAFFVTHSVAEAVFLSNRILVLSARPGRIHQEVTVDLPYPRTAHTRASADYQALVGRVSALLRSVENASPTPP